MMTYGNALFSYERIVDAPFTRPRPIFAVVGRYASALLQIINAAMKWRNRSRGDMAASYS